MLEMARGKVLMEEVSLVIGVASMNFSRTVGCTQIINVLVQHQEGVVVLVMTRGRELVEMVIGKELGEEVSLLVGLARMNITRTVGRTQIINVLGQHQEGMVVLEMTRGRELVEMVSLVVMGGSRRSLYLRMTLEYVN